MRWGIVALACSILSIAVVAGLPEGRGLGLTACDPGGNSIHLYLLPLPAGTRAMTYQADGRAGLAIVSDGCAYDEIRNNRGDGDEDVGFLGGAFPTYGQCLDPPVPPEVKAVLDPMWATGATASATA